MGGGAVSINCMCEGGISRPEVEPQILKAAIEEMKLYSPVVTIAQVLDEPMFTVVNHQLNNQLKTP